MLGQEQHQAAMRKYVEALGVYVEYNTTLVGLAQNKENVTVELAKTVDGQEIVEKARFAYVIGADGAHSKPHSFSHFSRCSVNT